MELLNCGTTRLFAVFAVLAFALGGCRVEQGKTPPPHATPEDQTPTETPYDTPSPTPEVDADQDGFTVGEGDCDDSNPAINPDAIETDCSDSTDYNCDGVVTYPDADLDDFDKCSDCNDYNPEVYPGAAELCDEIDSDCDGSLDDPDATGGTLWYADLDGDGYGNSEDSVTACVAPENYVAESQDCDDSDANFHPGAEELCTDPVDYNCDGELEYADVDGDEVAACLDCDDTDAEIKPGATELCDEVDNDCDGETDESDAADASTWYLDADSDGYGVDTDTVTACNQVEGYAAVAGDCDDTNPAFNPGAVEDDCTDSTDYNCDGQVQFADADEDGAPACQDCNDQNPDVNPSATEICNEIDDDCDTLIDDDDSDVTGTSTWYADSDGDTYGDLASSQMACVAPDGYVADSTDCDDGSAASNPAAIEICDEADNNCNDEIDESPTDGTTYYLDQDEDGYGSSTSTVACSTPPGYASNADDCDDTLADINPAMLEICDGVDNDCDGSVDPAGTCLPTDWLFRRAILVENGSGQDLNDYQIRLSLDTSILISEGKLQADCSDLRVASSQAFLPYWIEPNTCDSEATLVWTRLSSLPAGSADLHLYYGNDTVISESSLDSVFLAEIDGVQAGWSMDEGDGVLAEDSSGGGNDADLLNGPTWIEGVSGSGLAFDGTNDYGVGPSLEYSGGDMTLQVWVNPDMLENTPGYFVSQPWNVGGEYNYYLAYDTDGNIVFHLYGEHPYNITSSSSIPAEQWTHVVAMVGSSGEMSLYINGELSAEATHDITDWTPLKGDSDVGFTFGTLYPYGDGWSGNVDYSFDGKLDQLRIYRSLLAEDEIKSLYENGGYLTPNYPGVELVYTNADGVSAELLDVEEDMELVSYWSFDEGSGQTAKDLGNGGHDGVLGTGQDTDDADPLWIEDTNCVSGACLDFDGVDDRVSIASAAILDTQAPAFTISAWVKTTWYLGAIFGQYSSPGITGSDTSHYIKMQNGTVSIDEYPPNNGQTLGATKVNSESWRHVAVVVRGSERMIYIDGALSVTGVQEVYSGGAPNAVWLGARYYKNATETDSNDHFDGMLDEIRVYTYAQTEDEVLVDYQAGLDAMSGQ